jgi:hypothetical protein
MPEGKRVVVHLDYIICLREIPKNTLEVTMMRKYVFLFLVLAAVLTGISAAEIVKDFRYADVNFVPVDTMGTIDPSDDVILPAELGDLLPDADLNGSYEVRYVVQKKTGWVTSTNPGDLYSVVTINNTTATEFAINDTFGSQFDINPGKLCGGVEIIRIDAGGYATILTSTDQVVSATVDNDANTVVLEVVLETPLAADEELMVYYKFQTALKKERPDFSNFINEVDVSGEVASATIEFL